MRLTGNQSGGVRRATSASGGNQRLHSMRSGVSSGFGGFARASGGVRSAPMSAPAPIWLAALSAATHRASGDGASQSVRWNCVSDRAFYTNAGVTAEMIDPLGVRLECGQTLAVWWMPGDTSYSMEVYGRQEPRA